MHTPRKGKNFSIFPGGISKFDLMVHSNADYVDQTKIIYFCSEKSIPGQFINL